MSNSKDVLALDMSHQYLNLTIYNPSRTSAIKANVYQSFNEPIISRPSDYQVAVVKAFVPSSTVPLNNWATLLQGSAPYAPNPPSVLSITFQFGANLYQTYVNWDDSWVAGASAVGRFYLYSYLQFNKMVNDAFQVAYTAFNAAHPGVAPAAPVLLFEPLTGLFSYQAPKQYTVNPASPFYTGLKVWINDIFYTYIYSLLYRTYDNTNGTNGLMNYQLFTGELFSNTGNNVVTHNAIDYYVSTQEYSSKDTFNSFRSLVITSNLPTVSQYINLVETFNPNQQANNTIQFNILTELTPDLNSPQVVNYIPTAEYRLSDMSSNEPIRDVNLQIYWQDKTGLLNPLVLLEQDTITVKLLFRKKSWMNSMLWYLQSLEDREKDRVIRAMKGMTN